MYRSPIASLKARATHMNTRPCVNKLNSLGQLVDLMRRSCGAYLEGGLIKTGKGLPGTIWLKLGGTQCEICAASCRHCLQ